MGRWGWRSVALPLAGAALGGLLGWKVSSDALRMTTEAARLDFELAASQRTALIREALTAPAAYLDTLRRFFENSAEIETAEFSGFVSPWVVAEGGLRFAALREDGSLGAGFIEPDLAGKAAFLQTSGEAGWESAAAFVHEDRQRGNRLLIVRALRGSRDYRSVAVAADLSRRIRASLGAAGDNGIRARVSVAEGDADVPVYTEADAEEKEAGPVFRTETVASGGLVFTIRIEAVPDYLLRRRGYLGGILVPGAALLFALLGLSIERLAARGDRAERLRRAAFDDLDHFFSLDLDLFCVTDRDDRFVRTNPAWKRVFGYSSQELVGLSFLDLIHPDDRPEAREAAKNGRSGSIRNFTTRARRKDGSWLRVEWKTATLGERVYTAARDVTERVAYEERLRKALAEKETLLREVHHRVKNNMQIISSLLNLQGRDGDDPKLREAVERAQGRIRTMAMVHDALYHSDDFIDIEFDEYARSLASYCAYAADRQGFAVEVEPSGIRLALDLAIPCGLILNELATNSVLYAFNPSGKTTLTIALAEEGRRLRMTVSDDGQGLGEGFVVARDAKLGLNLVSSLASQVGGTLSIGEGPGTRVSIAFAPPPGAYVRRREGSARV